MDPQATAALVTAITALIGTVATAFVGLHRLQIEREKHAAERDRLQQATEQMRAEMAKLELETIKLRRELENIEREHLELKRTESEIARLQAETAKLQADLDEDRLRRLEKSRLMLQEAQRRREQVFDLQAAAFRGILARIYRIRNAVRDLLQLRDIRDRKGPVITTGELHKEIMGHYAALREALFAERDVLPEAFFRLAHGVEGLVYRWDTFETSGLEPSDLVGSPDTEQLLTEINAHYVAMVSFVRDHFGIDHQES